MPFRGMVKAIFGDRDTYAVIKKAIRKSTFLRIASYLKMKYRLIHVIFHLLDYVPRLNLYAEAYASVQ